jgi:hypothetical protein
MQVPRTSFLLPPRVPEHDWSGMMSRYTALLLTQPTDTIQAYGPMGMAQMLHCPMPSAVASCCCVRYDDKYFVQELLKNCTGSGAHLHVGHVAQDDQHILFARLLKFSMWFSRVGSMDGIG